MKIFVSRKIPGHALEKLQASEHEVMISDLGRFLSAEEFLRDAQRADAILTNLTDKMDSEMIDAIGPQLKIIANYAVGYNNIDVDAATQKGVIVTNTPSNEVNEAVADHTWALMLGLARRVVEADESTKRGSFRAWEPSVFLGTGMSGKTLGIIGMGRIGLMTARRAKGFEMRVLYHNRSRNEEAEGALGVEVEYRDFLSLLAESDFVSLHVPLTEETTYLINKDTIYKMKRGVFLINTSRGKLIKEQDLVDALRDGHVGGAALDVFENEPNIHPELITMENVILTPHVASSTREAREKMGNQAVDSILQVLRKEKPVNTVNEEVWDSARIHL